MSDYRQIRYEVSDGVATVVLDRPDRLNAFTYRMCYELLDVFDRIDADDAVHAVIVTGEGRAFCAGFDLDLGADSFDQTTPERRAEMAALGDIGGYPRDSGGAVTLRVAACLKPVIAAINGAAVGVGLSMTLAMDIRMAAADARLGFVFARRGIPIDAAACWFLPRAVGMQQAMAWVATGRLLSAEEARAGGLLLSVHDGGTVLDAATALAREIAENSSAVAVATSKQLMWEMSAAASPWDAHRLDSAATTQLGQGPDAREGVTAFFEKRRPRFTAKVPDDLPALGRAVWPAPPPDISPVDPEILRFGTTPP